MIFIPNEDYLEKNIETIDSFFSMLKNEKVDVVLIGWAGKWKKILKKKIAELRKKYEGMMISSFKLIVYNKNKGKLVYLVYLAREIGLDKYDMILVADHDIKPIDRIIDLGVLLDCMIVGDNKRIGMIGFRQIPDSRNRPDIFFNRHDVDGFSVYCFPQTSVCIASGCFLITPSIYAGLKNIKCGDEVYGLEDIVLGKLVDDNDFISIVSDYRVHHPFNKDIEYEENKKKYILGRFSV